MNNYFFQRQKGIGSFSCVYTAIRKKDGRLVAIKKGIENISLKEEYLLISNHNHPNLVRMLDYFEDRLFSYLVMEYCEQDLLTFVNDNDNLPEDRVKDIFIQLCLGIKYLHSNNIVHCDIKLDNILIYQNKIKLGDFGFASFFEAKKKKYIRGSLHYLAPEALIEVPVIGPSLDVWSLGIVLYALINKRFPLNLKEDNQENNLVEYLRWGVDEIKPQGSKQYMDLVSKMLEISVERRIKIHQILVHPWLLKLDLSQLTEKLITTVITPTESEVSPFSALPSPTV